MTTPQTIALNARSLMVRRGPKTLLDGVSITLRPGRVFAVIGPNGAGKSTLLRVLAGELVPDEGEVLLHGRPLSAWSSSHLARLRAVLPQESDLRFPFRVEEVVRLGRIPHAGGGDSAHDHTVAQEALHLTGLAPLSQRLYPTLSGGEKQRVHLARALAQLRPARGASAPAGRVLLLDEPTASLDLAHQHAVLKIARSLAVREQVAVLAILHDLNLALGYADEVVVLREGRLVASGSVRETLSPELIASVFGVSARRLDLPGYSRGQLLLGPAAQPI